MTVVFYNLSMELRDNRHGWLRSEMWNESYCCRNTEILERKEDIPSLADRNRGMKIYECKSDATQWKRRSKSDGGLMEFYSPSLLFSLFTIRSVCSFDSPPPPPLEKFTAIYARGRRSLFFYISISRTFKFVINFAAKGIRASMFQQEKIFSIRYSEAAAAMAAVAVNAMRPASFQPYVYIHIAQMLQ